MRDFQDLDGGSREADEGHPAADDGHPAADDGHPAGWIPTGDADATDEATAERAETSEEDVLDSLVRTAFDLLPTQVAVLDGDGTIVHTNRTWAAFGEANRPARPASTGRPRRRCRPVPVDSRPSSPCRCATAM